MDRVSTVYGYGFREPDERQRQEVVLTYGPNGKLRASDLYVGGSINDVMRLQVKEGGTRNAVYFLDRQQFLDLFAFMNNMYVELGWDADEH